MKAPRAIRILAIAVEAPLLQMAQAWTKSPEVRQITTLAEWDQLVGEISDETQDLILCGSEPFPVTLNELAQALTSLCAATPLCFVSTRAADLKYKDLQKNGFNQVLLLPTDRVLFKETVAKAEFAATGESQKLYRGVSLLDIGEDEPLDFDVSIFMPVNNKFIKLVHSGKALKGDKFEKLKKHHLNKVYIDPNQLPNFYRYSAERLKALNAPGGSASETERTEKLQQSIRKILFSVLDASNDVSFDAGRDILNDAQKIVSEAIGIGAAVQVHAQIANVLSQAAEDTGRDARVSTLAALFDMSLGRKQAHQAAIAGLFCGIGKTAFEPELQDKPLSEMTPEEKAKFMEYPAHSVRLLQNKRMVISPEVQTAILQHQESADGTGFPNHLPSSKISPLAQIVGLAVRFDELAFGQGGILRDPVTILNTIKAERRILPEYINPLIAMFDKKPAA